MEKNVYDTGSTEENEFIFNPGIYEFLRITTTKYLITGFIIASFEPQTIINGQFFTSHTSYYIKRK